MIIIPTICFLGLVALLSVSVRAIFFSDDDDEEYTMQDIRDRLFVDKSGELRSIDLDPHEYELSGDR